MLPSETIILYRRWFSEAAFFAFMCVQPDAYRIG